MALCASMPETIRANSVRFYTASTHFRPYQGPLCALSLT